MQSYTLTQTRNQHGEVFDRAAVEPVLITKQSRPSYVIISSDTYQQLLARLTELEDMLLGQQATAAVSRSAMVGSETFVATLTQLANGET
ncbi:type II toxin-antitoxin system Phd/YefM family antitoxin [[Phormidium] sp. ETS-05]|uniref:type II toxin-antitoxin system Phd/YefM family antitoxin n=1 Tax=[Phormidium] sp. ETS-05 TaxID=222819 RepID=UPI0018EECEE0|nr:type II toxin-antitoxin system Phd/YefM family antitoxin [[Phormidium] sp. ETS-05]